MRNNLYMETYRHCQAKFATRLWPTLFAMPTVPSIRIGVIFWSLDLPTLVTWWKQALVTKHDLSLLAWSRRPNLCRNSVLSCLSWLTWTQESLARHIKRPSALRCVVSKCNMSLSCCNPYLNSNSLSATSRQRIPLEKHSLSCCNPFLNSNNLSYTTRNIPNN